MDSSLNNITLVNAGSVPWPHGPSSLHNKEYLESGLNVFLEDNVATRIESRALIRDYSSPIFVGNLKSQRERKCGSRNSQYFSRAHTLTRRPPRLKKC